MASLLRLFLGKLCGRRAGLMSLMVLLSGISTVVHAEQIVRWVDAEGRVHFGNAQFAPQDRAEPVDLAPANRMDVPARANPGARSSNTRGGAGFVRVPHSTKPRLKKGFRGHHGRPKHN